MNLKMRDFYNNLNPSFNPFRDRDLENPFLYHAVSVHKQSSGTMPISDQLAGVFFENIKT